MTERAEDKELTMIEALERDVAEMAYQLYEVGYIAVSASFRFDGS